MGWALEYDTAHYLNWKDLHRALDYGIEQERYFSFKRLSADDLLSHITQFVSGIWHIHAFCEGNTRTTAVFTILYLRDIGFSFNLNEVNAMKISEKALYLLNKQEIDCK